MTDARKAYEKNLEALARAAYSRHVIDARWPANGPANEWVIRREEDRWLSWTHIISRPPFLVLVGDGETCVFRGHPNDGELGMVRWIARSNVDYLADKLDMGEPRVGRTINADVLIADLEDRVHERVAEIRDKVLTTVDPDHELEVLSDALAMAERGDTEGARGHVASELRDGWEIAEGLGSVVAPRVFYARHACRRLLALLDTVRPEPAEVRR